MKLDENLIIWMVDDKSDDLRVYHRILQQAFERFNVPLVVEPVPARQHIGDYLDIVGDPRTAAIIVDQQLHEARGTDHTGIQLAKRLRSLVTKLPIYILTSYAESADFEGSEGSVEDILSKQDMSDPGQMKTIVERLTRRIFDYNAFLDERDNRFRKLLKKHLTAELTPKEKGELDELRFERTAVVLSDEEYKVSRLEAALDRLKNLQSSHDK